MLLFEALLKPGIGQRYPQFLVIIQIYYPFLWWTLGAFLALDKKLRAAGLFYHLLWFSVQLLSHFIQDLLALPQNSSPLA